MKKFWHDNSLSIILFAIFFFCLIGMSVSGWLESGNEAREHGAGRESYLSYLGSGDFIEGVFENWESEFLQMWALVVLTIFLHQKGAEDSKPLRGKTLRDTSSRYSLLRSETWRSRVRALGHGLYAHSLSLALLAIFFFSFVAHGIGGVEAYNQDQQRHGQPTASLISYMTTSRFWYESLQNWQSEFLAVGVLLVLSIKLRERGSPQSKPIGTSYDAKTGA